eukprot:scaffold22667_cov31-Phaeocystis_antarctica.AAC.1
MLTLARLRVAREWGPRAVHRKVGQGAQVSEAAREALVLPVLACAVFLVVRAHVKHALVGRVDVGPHIEPLKVVEGSIADNSVTCNFLTACGMQAPHVSL